MLESTLERKLKSEISRLGGWAVKFVSPGLAGVPDRLILLPGGTCIFIELKAPGKKLRPLQVKRQKQLEEFGFRVEVVDSIERIQEVCKMVQERGDVTHD